MIPYKIVRSNRKTVTICIVGGEVAVKAPLRTSLKHIESFVEQKSAWIQKKLAEYSRKTDILEQALNGESILYNGRFFKIERTDSVKRIALGDGALLLPIKYGLDGSSERAIAAWYKRVAAKELPVALAKISAETGLGYKSFATTNARTKWGSCDGNCNVRLNWRLVMLAEPFVRYVIVHELAHTVHHDHSAAFWAVVKKHMPDYADVKKRLKTFSVLTSLYR